jgi:hypothetical protein
MFVINGFDDMGNLALQIHNICMNFVIALIVICKHVETLAQLCCRSRMFTVVPFLESEEVEVVSRSWVVF